MWLPAFTSCCQAKTAYLSNLIPWKTYGIIVKKSLLKRTIVRPEDADNISLGFQVSDLCF